MGNANPILTFENGDRLELVSTSVSFGTIFCRHFDAKYTGQFHKVNSTADRTGSGLFIEKDFFFAGDYGMNGIKNGNGFLSHFTEKYTFIGNFLNDQFHGKGRITYSNGNMYTGDFITGLRCGTGTCRYANGNEYSGQWVNDNPNGLGRFTYNNGDIYTGHIVNGLRDGNGTCDYFNGDRYTGNWIVDKREGRGEITYSSGDVYSGDFINNTRHGRGTSIERDSEGRTYTGDWYNDMKQGHGVEVVFTLGHKRAKYVGQFKSGVYHGVGSYMYANGDIYEGEWQYGRQHGRGRYIRSNCRWLRCIPRSSTCWRSIEHEYRYGMMIPENYEYRQCIYNDS